MKKGLKISRIWSDDDLMEFRVESFDGFSGFDCELYQGYKNQADLIDTMKLFKDRIHGGICDIAIGSFGPEYAGGAFHARFHFQRRGLINITVRGQSDFFDFGEKKIASEATLHLTTEPALLDRFIGELKWISVRDLEESRSAFLEIREP